MKSQEEIIIDEIERVRGDNNKLWMNIMRSAMRANPARTKAIVRLINQNDKKISGLMEKLGETNG